MTIYLMPNDGGSAVTFLKFLKEVLGPDHALWDDLSTHPLHGAGIRADWAAHVKKMQARGMDAHGKPLNGTTPPGTPGDTRYAQTIIQKNGNGQHNGANGDSRTGITGNLDDTHVLLNDLSSRISGIESQIGELTRLSQIIAKQIAASQSANTAVQTTG